MTRVGYKHPEGCTCAVHTRPGKKCEPGCRCKRHALSTRKANSDAHKGKIAWNKGKKLGRDSDAMRDRKRLAQLRRWRDTPEAERKKHMESAQSAPNPRNAGKSHSAATRQRISEGNSTPEVLAKHTFNHGRTGMKQTSIEAELQNALDNRTWKYIGNRYLIDGSVNRDQKYKGRVPVGADFVSLSKKTLIWVDGCYWHRCVTCFPQYANTAETKKRHEKDARIVLQAEKQGWSVIRVWGHDIRENLNSVVSTINTRKVA